MTPTLDLITISVHQFVASESRVLSVPNSSSSLKQGNVRMQQNKQPFPAKLYLL